MKQSSQWWQFCLPQLTFSRFMGWLANCRCQFLKNWQIKMFIRRYKVDMQEAKIQNYRDYPTFNAFFTRYLKASSRPINTEAGAIVSPVDGIVSAIGELQGDQLLQAKGKQYSLESLLGGDEQLHSRFMGGSFFTAYLAPSNYHRIHMPCSARLLEMIYIPGRLFSVNTQSVAAIDNLFARNERVVTLFETDFGYFALVAVGAMVVGSIVTAWQGVVNAKHPRTITRWDYSAEDIRLNCGEEWGYFQLGSTVILLFPPHMVNWQSHFKSLSIIKMGQKIGTLLNSEGASYE